MLSRMTEDTPRRTVRVPDQLWSTAQDIALRRGETVAAVVRQALERYIRRNK